jgi:hypothetical protein
MWFFSRADGAAHSSQSFVVLFGAIKGQQPWSHVGNRQKFHNHEFWWVQDIPDAYRTHSTVLCIEILLFGERKNKKSITTKDLERKFSSRWASRAASPYHPAF